MKEIIFYEKENGKIPINDFFELLNISNEKLLAKFYYKLDFLKLWLLWKNDIKYIKDKVYELRVKKWTDIWRVLYFCYLDNKIVILDWLIKKDNKLNKKFLRKIFNYKADFIKRFWKIK